MAKNIDELVEFRRRICKSLVHNKRALKVFEHQRDWHGCIIAEVHILLGRDILSDIESMIASRKPAKKKGSDR